MIKIAKVLQCFLLVLLLATASSLPAQSTDPLIPNVFTPNGDLVNDIFIAEGLSGDWTMRIFDRWGNLIFETEQATIDGWDGHNILGIEVVSGVYYYTLEQQNTDMSYHGVIHLFR